MLDLDTFRALCTMVSKEKDPAKLEVLKERMKLLLMEARTNLPAPETFVS